jgi:hypothetical protein
MAIGDSAKPYGALLEARVCSVEQGSLEIHPLRPVIADADVVQCGLKATIQFAVKSRDRQLPAEHYLGTIPHQLQETSSEIGLVPHFEDIIESVHHVEAA